MPELRPALVDALHERGLAPVQLEPRSRTASACGDSMVSEDCQRRLHEAWSDRWPSLLVVGAIGEQGGSRDVELLVLQRDEPQPVARMEARFVDGDLILPIVFPMALAERVEQRVDPPAPPSPAELEVLARLDEPPPPRGVPVVRTSTPAPAPPPPPMTRPVVMKAPGGSIDDAIDLRRDFEQVCRSGPRRRRTSPDDPRDLRPSCRLGPTLGYVRPRTWVVASMFVASSVATGLAFRAERQGDLGAAGQRTAGEWARATAAMTGAFGLSTVVLAITDRRQARRHLRDERWLSAH